MELEWRIALRIDYRHPGDSFEIAEPDQAGERATEGWLLLRIDPLPVGTEHLRYLRGRMDIRREGRAPIVDENLVVRSSVYFREDRPLHATKAHGSPPRPLLTQDVEDFTT